MAVKSEKKNLTEKQEKPMSGFWNGVQNEEKRKYVKARTTRAGKKAGFAGVLYFLGSLALAVLAFLPMLYPIQWKYGELGLLTFWKPFTELGLLLNPAERAAAALNLTMSLLFVIPLLVCVCGAFCSLAKLDNLFMKGNRRIGYNQNYLALKKMAKAFSAAYASIAVCSYCLKLLTGVSWTYLFYFSSAAILCVHFLCGLVGGTVSRFSIEKGFLETPRKYGLFSVLFRNVMQFVAITGVLYFLLRANLLPVVFTYLESGFLGALSSATVQEIVTVVGFPVLELLAFIFIVVIWRHAVNPTEYDLDGPNAKGRKTVRVASFFAFLFTLAINVCLFIFAAEKSLEAFNRPLLYVSGILLALFIFECLMGDCPKLRKKYRNAEEPAPIPMEELAEAPVAPVAQPVQAPVAAPVSYCCPFSQGETAECLAATPVFDKLGYGGVYVQPDGSQVVVLPVLGNAAAFTPQQQVQKVPTAEELHARAVADKWIAAAKEKSSPTGFSAAAYVEENKHLLAPTAQASVEQQGTELRVRCPKCGALHKITKPNRVVTCKKCGERFELSQWTRV